MPVVLVAVLVVVLGVVGDSLVLKVVVVRSGSFPAKKNHRRGEQNRGLKSPGAKKLCKSLRNGPYKKDSATRQGMQEGVNFCTTLLLLYHTSDWLNQYKVPKLQLAVYIFIRN